MGFWGSFFVFLRMFTGNEGRETRPIEPVSQLNYMVITNDPTVLLLTKAISYIYVFAS